MKRSAFTLIELLAVIAVIGILVAILIPVIGSVREQAHQATCTSNVRQLSAAYLLMMSDNNNMLIPGIKAGEGGNVPESKWWDNERTETWNMALDRYMHDGDRFNRLNDINCPVALEAMGGEPSERSSYGFNHYIGKTTNPDNPNNGFRGAMRIEQLADPGRTIMFGDTALSGSGKNTFQNLGSNTIFAWHGDHANISYFDGSVGTITIEEAEAKRPNTDEGYIFWRGVRR